MLGEEQACLFRTLTAFSEDEQVQLQGVRLALLASVHLKTKTKRKSSSKQKSKSIETGIFGSIVHQCCSTVKITGRRPRKPTELRKPELLLRPVSGNAFSSSVNALNFRKVIGSLAALSRNRQQRLTEKGALRCCLIRHNGNFAAASSSIENVPETDPVSRRVNLSVYFLRSVSPSCTCGCNSFATLAENLRNALLQLPLRTEVPRRCSCGPSSSFQVFFLVPIIPK